MTLCSLCLCLLASRAAAVFRAPRSMWTVWLGSSPEQRATSNPRHFSPCVADSAQGRANHDGMDWT